MKYKDKKWERVREAVLRRDGYMCVLSKRYGKKRQADTVHHIFPADEYPQYRYEGWNLISLTGAVHNTLHDRVTGKLTEQGKELLRRTARSRGMEIPEEHR